jgi:hypothetical protein
MVDDHERSPEDKKNGLCGAACNWLIHIATSKAATARITNRSARNKGSARRYYWA